MSGQALACAERAAAVVAQAFRDGCEPRATAPPGEPVERKRARSSATKAEQLEAWEFLTATAGGWMEARCNWCWVVGVDPELVRAEALRRGPSHQVAEALAERRQRKEGLLMGGGGGAS